MLEFKNISQGFINLVKSELGIANPDIEKLAIERLNICNTCSFRSNFPDIINRLSSCKSCGCNLVSKVRSKSKCPKEKW